MQYMLLIYEDERINGGPEKNGPVLQEMMAKHMGFAPTLGSARKGGAGPQGYRLRDHGSGRQRQADGP